MTETIHCSSCGVAISHDASFCEFCGAGLPPGSAPIDEPETQTAPNQPVSVNQALGISTRDEKPAHSHKPEGRAALTMTRYREGYLHARAINGIGTVIKVVALIIGGILLVVGLGVVDHAGNFGVIGGFGGIGIILIGLLIGGFGYILGVLVQSLGQFMKAHFDCAVYQSHFLNDDQRAEVMSLE